LYERDDMSNAGRYKQDGGGNAMYVECIILNKIAMYARTHIIKD
jgi:hypothetical protein